MIIFYIVNIQILIGNPDNFLNTFPDTENKTGFNASNPYLTEDQSIMMKPFNILNTTEDSSIYNLNSINNDMDQENQNYRSNVSTTNSKVYHNSMIYFI